MAVANPYRRKLDREAWEAGRDARANGSPGAPRAFADQPALRRAWERGWQDAAPPAVEHQEPPVERLEAPAVTHRGGVELVVPADEDLGPRMVYVRPQLVPCRCCRRVRLDDLSQACVVTGTKESIVYMRCRACASTACAACRGRMFPVPSR